MIKVVKRNGRVEEFAREKITVSCLKAGADIETAREIARRIEEELIKKERISTNELRSKVLEMLKEKNPKWHENWLVYDRAVKKRTT
ncbi:MAG: ATP cone domain-containing protein [archaeon GB-1867-005]|nr:ATP cone domain-containing protein [Candidatus Culexmicrobium cathedralense]